MSYLININDEQRLALAQVLSLHKDEFERPQNGEDHPLKYWISMLKELPQVEPTYGTDKFPTMIHGFCL